MRWSYTRYFRVMQQNLEYLNSQIDRKLVVVVAAVVVDDDDGLFGDYCIPMIDLKGKTRTQSSIKREGGACLGNSQERVIGSLHFDEIAFDLAKKSIVVQKWTFHYCPPETWK